MRFSFYGKLIVSISDNAPSGYRRYFENEYARISSRSASIETSQPMVSVHIFNTLPKPHPGDIVRSVRIKNLFRFQYIVRNAQSTRPQIFFRSHRIGMIYPLAVCVYLQSHVLEPLMYAKLIEQDVILLHAAGVTSGNNAFLFPADGGTGKTSLAIKLLDENFRLLGDDLIFVDVRSLRALPYQRPLHLFGYNLAHMGSARLPFSYRTAIGFKNAMRYILERVYKSEFLISTRVHADKLFANPFGEGGAIRAVYFLTKEGPDIESMEVEGHALEKNVDRILESSDLRQSLVSLLPPEALDAVFKKERRLTKDLLSSLNAMKYLNIRTFGRDVGAMLRESL